MLEQIIEYIQDVSKKHILVNTVKYQGRININQQGNNRYMQVVIEDDVYIEQTMHPTVMAMTINMNILGFPTKDKSVLKVQSDALQVAVEILKYIEADPTYKNRLSINEYSFMSLSDYTDDNCAGQRVTISLKFPNPINLCEYQNHFVDKVEEEKNTDREITLKPIKL